MKRPPLKLLSGDDERDRALIRSGMLRRAARCYHEHAAVDELARTVYCQDCETQLDPIQVLSNLSREYDRQEHAIADAKRRATAAEKEAIDAEKARDRLRGQRNRAGHAIAASLQWEDGSILLPLTADDIKLLAGSTRRLRADSRYTQLARLIERAYETIPNE